MAVEHCFFLCDHIDFLSQNKTKPETQKIEIK